MLSLISFKSLSDLQKFIDQHLPFAERYSEQFIYEYLTERLWVTDRGETYIGRREDYDYSSFAHHKFRLTNSRVAKLNPDQSFLHNDSLARLLAKLAKMPQDQISFPQDFPALLMPFSTPYHTNEADLFSFGDDLYRNYALEDLLWLLYEKELEQYDNKHKRIILQQTLSKLDANIKNFQESVDSIKSAKDSNIILDNGIICRITTSYPEFRGKMSHELNVISKNIEADIEQIKSTTLKAKIALTGLIVFGIATVVVAAVFATPVIIAFAAAAALFEIGLGGYALWKRSKESARAVEFMAHKKSMCIEMANVLDPKRYQHGRSKQYDLEGYIQDAKKYKNKIEKTLRQIDKAENHQRIRMNDVRPFARQFSWFRKDKPARRTNHRAPLRRFEMR